MESCAQMMGQVSILARSLIGLVKLPRDLSRVVRNMAVQSMLVPAPAQPPKPIRLRGWAKRASKKCLEVLWQADDPDVQVFELEVRYYNFGDLRVRKDNPVHCISHEVTEGAGCGTLVPDPEGFCQQKGWVVTVILKSKSRDGNLTGSAQIQTAWDDEQTEQASREDLEQRSADFEKKHVSPFLQVKGDAGLEILIIGGQHYGKSSFINHLVRCIQFDLKRFDEMDPAPAGLDEKTKAVKRLTVPVGGKEITFMDTPALSNMDEINTPRLQAMLRKWFPDGTRREDLKILWHNYLCLIGRRPPHAAIVVVSLCKWQNEPRQVQEYLEEMAKEFKNASSHRVEFPYVVAATHRDEFLECVKDEDPMQALETAVSGIKAWASTEHVYPITNYKQDSMGSEKNNKETFDLLGQLVTKAKNQETSARCFVDFKGLF